MLLSAAAPLSPLQSVALVDARPDHVAAYAPLTPIQQAVAHEIVTASYRAGIPPSVALATGWRESRFIP